MAGAIEVSDPETALAVTDEEGNVVGVGASANDASTTAGGAPGGNDVPTLAVGGAVGLLAGLAGMALVMRRRTPMARQRLDPTD